MDVLNVVLTFGGSLVGLLIVVAWFTYKETYK